MRGVGVIFLYFFFNETATPGIYTLARPGALRISPPACLEDRRNIAGRVFHSPEFRDRVHERAAAEAIGRKPRVQHLEAAQDRSEEHTSELQSRQYLVCRLLPETNTKTVSDVRVLS